MEEAFKDGYYFYVLSTNEDGTTNLIMDRNINSDGTPVTKAIVKDKAAANNGIYNLLPWVSKADYNDDTNYGTNGNNNKGPITAMNFLYNATSTWTNIPNITMDYKSDDTSDYEYIIIKTTNNITQILKEDGTIVKVLIDQDGYANLKSRMPYKSEVSNYNTSTKEKAYLYDYLHLSNNIQTNSISSIYGYWTFAPGGGYTGAWLEHRV